jgi:predicted dienelactone hydrolase
MPRDYKRVLTVMREAEEHGLSDHEALGRVMVTAHG